MKETNELILDASLEVFSEKGYTSATTLEISKRAGVSEMTLFRHFQTKNNLFLASMKQAIGTSIVEDSSIDLNISLRDFVWGLMHEKMFMISKQHKVIKMLIRETLAHTVPEELKFTKMIYNQVIKKISLYVKHHELDIDSVSFAELVVGLLLRYAIMEEQPIYHILEQDEQKKHITSYLNILNI